MIKNLFLLLFFIGIGILSNAQNETDALRYSFIGTGGTARYQSLAGAMGAVGGDPSCMAANPAGLARYTKSDFTISFAHSDIETATVYNDETAYHGKGNFGLNNLALIGAYRNTEDNDWKAVQFGFSYQKLYNFNNAILISGDGGNSLLDQFATDAYGTAPSYLYDSLHHTSWLAYETYLIDPDIATPEDDYTTQTFGQGMHQERSLNKKGSFSEVNLTLSGNYKDKMYFGMSIGFPFVRYKEFYSHTEEVLDTTLFLQNFIYSQDLTTRGNGINLKGGLIYTPAEWLRLGIALQTSSSIGLTDEWNTAMSSKFDLNIAFDTTSEKGIYNYRLKTPGRITASAAFILSKWGLVSIDYEYLNYGRAKFKTNTFYGSDGYSFNSENLVIKSIYNKSSNIRAGLEARYRWITLRGGYSVYGNPFKQGATTVDSKRATYSFGAGFRMKGFFADVSYSITKWNEAYFLYDPLLVNTANIGTTFKQFVVTTGFRF
jgi:hypothetical protein